MISNGKLSEWFVDGNGIWRVIFLFFVSAALHIVIRSPITYIWYLLSLPVIMFWIDKSTDCYRDIASKACEAKKGTALKSCKAKAERYDEQYTEQIIHVMAAYVVFLMVLTSDYTYYIIPKIEFSMRLISSTCQ